MTKQEIISHLPYQEPFLFVDELLEVSEDGIKGSYHFKKDEYFYKGHFKNNPITPGVILTETMAQIGVVCLGIYLIRDYIKKSGFPKIALTSNTINFYLPVYPNETVIAISEKEYFRFNKLKCNVQLFNEREELICKGVIAGMIMY